MPLESGFEITPPAGVSFRFAETKTYQRLKGAAIKEMDFGWFSVSRNELILVELTNYDASLKPIDRKALMKEMVEKGRDSVLMLHAAWSQFGAGRDLSRELPQLCCQHTLLRLCFVIKAKRDELEVIVNADIKGRLATVLKTYANLMNVDVEVDLLGPAEAMARLPVTMPMPSGSPIP